MTGICQLSSIALRSEPSHRSQMVSQLIYGETYDILANEGKDWLRIQCAFDNYTGFIPANQYFPFEREGFPLLFTGNIAMDQVNNLVPKGAEIYHRDDLVEVEDDELLDLGNIHFTSDQIRENIFRHSTSLIHSPYLWGGRTPWGMDCSGFTQIIYKLCGIRLPRDSHEQDKLGNSVSLDESTLGDLAFFADKEGKIVHTGIVFGKQMIIHCSGWVRVDSLDLSGITNLDTGEKTHSLYSIRRIIE